ncbi:radical SAM/SPASM domain protein, ACGX system [Methanosphaerula palustris]|nr:radical SAM/SPASM domain protein, ACGX system [Methanosphaerula palustris]
MKKTMEQYFAFQLHITDRCDQCCQHCYIYSENSSAPVRELTYEQIVDIIDNCTDMCRKIQRIPYYYITGGDPILHKDFWKVLELLKSKNIPFGILGNPFHLNAEICTKLKHLGCERYQLSIDGLRKTHDAIRKPGSFDTTIEKIAYIRDAGIICAVMTTVSHSNLLEIPGIIDLVVKNHVDVFAFARYCPTSFERCTHVSPMQYKALLKKCWEKFEEYKDRGTTFNLKDHLWTLYLYEKGLFSIPKGLDATTIYDGCNCGNCHLTILSNGEIYACRRFESNIGNIFKDRLYDVFFGSEMDKKYRESKKFEKCSTCELLRFCRGCPAVAYGYTHDFYAADPQCWKGVI